MVSRRSRPPQPLSVANGGPDAAANATADDDDPTNTFVSLRVNSDGTTGDVAQEILRQELEVVDGESIERAVRDLLDRIWSSIDLGSGARSHSPRTERTPTSASPSTTTRCCARARERTSSGRGTWSSGRADSSTAPSRPRSQQSQVTWNFDCDPENRIQRTAARADARRRGDLVELGLGPPGAAGLVWRRDDVIPIPTCPLCTYMFDFHWLSFEPETPRAACISGRHALDNGAVRGDTSQRRLGVCHRLGDEPDRPTPRSQSQHRHVRGRFSKRSSRHRSFRSAEAQAGAELTDAVNFSVDTGGVVAQTNLAQSEAEALITAAIVQQIAQQLNGEDSFQAQLALQSATTTQEIFSAGTATLVKNANVGVSIGGTSTQSASSVASARGVEVATTRQTVEQEQEGADSDQEQIAGQWAVVAQQFELLAGAALADTRNESTLRGEASNLRLESEAGAAGSSAGTIDQLAIQLQSGDSTALQQESFQQATIEQDGIGLAAATAGGTRLIYRTPPPAQLFMAAPETIAPLAAIAEPVAGTEAALAEPVLLALPQITAVAGRAAPSRSAAKGRRREARRAARERSDTSCSAPSRRRLPSSAPPPRARRSRHHFQMRFWRPPPARPARSRA